MVSPWATRLKAPKTSLHLNKILYLNLVKMSKMSKMSKNQSCRILYLNRSKFPKIPKIPKNFTGARPASAALGRRLKWQENTLG
jgi:hypothetical protein